MKFSVTNVQWLNHWLVWGPLEYRVEVDGCFIIEVLNFKRLRTYYVESLISGEAFLPVMPASQHLECSISLWVLFYLIVSIVPSHCENCSISLWVLFHLIVSIVLSHCEYCSISLWVLFYLIVSKNPYPCISNAWISYNCSKLIKLMK